MRRLKLLSILAIVLALICLAVETAPVYASLQGLEKEKDKVDRRLRIEQGNLKQHRSREAQLSGELAQLDRRLEELQSELTRVNREIGATEEEIARTEEILVETETELDTKESLFKRRLRAIYEQGSVSYIDILFRASSFSDFLTRFNNLKIIAANDQCLIEEVRAERDRIEEMKKKLEQEKNRLDGMRRQILSSEAELERTVTSRKAVMGELQQEIIRNEKLIQEIKAKAKKLEEEIQAIIRQSDGGDDLAGISGKLLWPAEDSQSITSNFGWRLDPGTGHTSWHTGIDIGTAGYIRAAETGRVIWAAWKGGYGNCIIVNHGGGITTLYAHLSTMSVASGQLVSRGQRIGIAGNTGRSFGIHLHFEVRVNEQPVNPILYLY